MIFNAAQKLPPALDLLPEITIKHYSYLRDTMPNLVPTLPIGGTSTELTLTEGSTGSRQFLETILNNIQASYSAPRARQALLTAAQDNLDRLAAIDPELSGTANYTATFLGAKLLIEQLQSCLTMPTSRTPSKECLNQLMKKCLKLQNLFSSLTTNDLLMVKQISLRASALHLVLIVKDRSQSALAPCQLLLLIAADTNQFLNENPYMRADAFTTSILNQISSMNDPKPGRVFREILPIVQTASPVASPEININVREYSLFFHLILNCARYKCIPKYQFHIFFFSIFYSQIKICTARILDPTSAASSDNVIKVTAGLIAAIPFLAEIDNLRESQRLDLRMRIKYPDQNVHLMVPRMRDLKRMVTENGEDSK